MLETFIRSGCVICNGVVAYDLYHPIYIFFLSGSPIHNLTRKPVRLGHKTEVNSTIEKWLLMGVKFVMWQFGLIQVQEEGWTGFSGPREIPSGSPASPMKTPSITTLLLGFTFNLKKGHFGDISFFSNIDVWRSIIVAKFLEYVYCIIRIFLVLLWHCYVPKIQFYIMIFSLVKKT